MASSEAPLERVDSRVAAGEYQPMRSRKTKFIFVTGGVVSSLGTGMASASMGALL